MPCRTLLARRADEGRCFSGSLGMGLLGEQAGGVRTAREAAAIPGSPP